MKTTLRSFNQLPVFIVTGFLLMLLLQLGYHHFYKTSLLPSFTQLSQWLKTLYELNPQSDYPAFLASRVYSQVDDPQKIRIMIDLIDDLFRRNPQQHWRRMTEACLLAKHQLRDLILALKGKVKKVRTQ